MAAHRRLFGTTAAAAILTLLLVIAPLPTGARAQSFDVDHFTLGNGLEIIVIENHRAPIVSHMIWYKVGAADEPIGKSGLAHFFEHLMFMGTDTREPGEFSDIVARNGGRENAFTSQDYTGYFQNLAADRLELVMELEADRMRNLTLTAEIIEPERLVIIEERRQRTESTPGGLFGEQLNAAHYSAHPYRLPVIGWEHEIGNLSLEDLTSFYDSWYAPNNAVLVVAGDVEADEVLALARKYYGPIRPRDIPERTWVVEPPRQAPRTLTMRDPRVEDPSWIRRYLAPSYRVGQIEHAYALQVLAEILGGGTTSRLYRSLVVKHEVAVSASAAYTPSTVGPGTFGTSFTPKNGNAVETVLPLYQAEIEKLLTTGAALDEVEAAKQRILDSEIFAQDSLQTAARIFGSALVRGRSVEEVLEWPAHIAAVTPHLVNEAARAVFIERNSTTGILLPSSDTGS